jgi:hypothetical protein
MVTMCNSHYILKISAFCALSELMCLCNNILCGINSGRQMELDTKTEWSTDRRS